MTSKAPGLPLSQPELLSQPEPLSQPAQQGGRHPRKEVTTMIKKIQQALLSRCKRVSDQPRDFNEDLLNAHREDVFVLMHQNMGGLR
jgi:hypothetical protein